MARRTTTATTLAALALLLTGLAWAQGPARSTQNSANEMQLGMAMAMLPMVQAALEACQRDLPQQSQGIQATWDAHMKNPRLKAHAQTAEYRAELAEFRAAAGQAPATAHERKRQADICLNGLK